MLPHEAAYFLSSAERPGAPRQEPPQPLIGDKMVVGFFKLAAAATVIYYVVAVAWR
ncbi:hypothetical protein AGMMS49959_19420 [Planctomycetales bacterium]|nr:hypothetical protein AGMMS49959_19420 [Planctomycetales bacterium]